MRNNPFSQCPGFKKGSPVTVNKLGMELSAGNNTILFDHNFDNDTEHMAPDVLSRYLVAAHSFSVGGGRSSTINFKHAPLVGKAMIVIKGETLQKTLLLNLVPYDPENPTKPLGLESTDTENEDLPTWELDEPDVPGGGRYVNGYIDYLTWQSRCINLIPEHIDDTMCSRAMYFAQGPFIKNELIRDPFVAYRNSEKYGVLPVQLERDKDLWRSYASLTHLSSKNRTAPYNIKTVADLVEEDVIKPSSRYILDVIGMCTNQAKVHQWRHSRMPLPMRVLHDQDVVNSIDFAIRFAEKIGSNLDRSLKYVYRKLLEADESASKRQMFKDSSLPSAFTDVLVNYWAGLEVPFYSFVDSMVKSNTPSETNVLHVEWAEKTVKNGAARTFENFLNNLGTAPRILKAAVHGRSFFYSHIYKSIEEVKKDHDIE
jgi:CRISPR type I-E-associated protein CasA/Cse1